MMFNATSYPHTLKPLFSGAGSSAAQAASSAPAKAAENGGNIVALRDALDAQTPNGQDTLTLSSSRQASNGQEDPADNPESRHSVELTVTGGKSRAQIAPEAQAILDETFPESADADLAALTRISADPDALRLIGAGGKDLDDIDPEAQQILARTYDTVADIVAIEQAEERLANLTRVERDLLEVNITYQSLGPSASPIEKLIRLEKLLYRAGVTPSYTKPGKRFPYEYLQPPAGLVVETESPPSPKIVQLPAPSAQTAAKTPADTSSAEATDTTSSQPMGWRQRLKHKRYVKQLMMLSKALDMATARQEAADKRYANELARLNEGLRKKQGGLTCKLTLPNGKDDPLSAARQQALDILAERRKIYAQIEALRKQAAEQGIALDDGPAQAPGTAVPEAEKDYYKVTERFCQQHDSIAKRQDEVRALQPDTARFYRKQKQIAKRQDEVRALQQQIRKELSKKACQPTHLTSPGNERNTRKKYLGGPDNRTDERHPRWEAKTI